MGLASPETDEERKLAALVDSSFAAGWRDCREAAIGIIERLLEHSDNRVANAATALILSIKSELRDDDAGS